MTDERYKFIEDNIEEKLTEEEIAQGWHFCQDWDMLLVGPDMCELENCLCESDAINKARAELRATAPELYEDNQLYLPEITIKLGKQCGSQPTDISNKMETTSESS